MKSILISIISINCIFAQEIPNEFYQYKFVKYSLDIGDNWDKNTTFGPLRYTHKNNIPDSLIINMRLGTILFSEAKSVYGFGHFTFQSNFHGYLYSRIVNKVDLFDRYSGIPRDIDRIGFSSGETDLSGISYENEWMIIQFGRGRQSWGAGNDIQLALSETSNGYDYGMLDLNFGRLKVRYFHGYLETDSLFYNRYITGRGIEWNNQRNLLFGLSEVVVYSGENRSIDFAYFNPISTHLEIELNDRQNDIGTDNGNAIWQGSIDYSNNKNFRISGNYLFDEFVIDKKQKDEGKGHWTAYSFKCVYTPFNTELSLTSCYVSIIRIGSNTFKHEDGKNNFVHRNKPLGWAVGSDIRDIRFGINRISKTIRYYGNIEIGRMEIGEKNIMQSPYSGYADYPYTEFPNVDDETITFVKTHIQWWLKPYFSIISEIKINKSDRFNIDNEFRLGIDIFIPIKKYI